ncbi:hypothetical protein RZS08_50165, partial [Arthrospira platensis SPKY1]|nr:hypothetical protein [Arthrospira platensis SPKY1]
MTTKNLFIAMLALCLSAAALCARTATFKITFEALDLSGEPIRDVRVQYGYDNPRGPRATDGGHGFTDQHGQFT